MSESEKDPVAATLMELDALIRDNLNIIAELKKRVESLELRLLEVEHELMDLGGDEVVSG